MTQLEEIGRNLSEYEDYSKNRIMVTADHLCRKYGKENDDSMWAALWHRSGLSVKQIRWLLMEHVHGNLTCGGKQFSLNRQRTMWGVRRLIESGETKLQSRLIYERCSECGALKKHCAQ